ncbi:pyridoxamine 5'-phosphate oxidase family protein [Uliginosibacterium sp. H1]|uniref:pyridoxamine 5'-phosphate oxidase family protein n=1 Tax=Uliginosibacterium sp. H1 TaxID=3114757 RepID=UPI002E179490|nr:pyridoxamine 5'-phosphate oxidase family protein [Uliginosibacterium sp. H1]
MPPLTMKDISAVMRDIDICMMTTRTSSGELEARPMSNNRQVEYEGDSWFFARDDASAVQEIGADPGVGLSFQREATLGLYVSVTGQARVVDDRDEMAEHWVDGLNRWFPQGLDTDGLVMIHVRAARVKYWKDGEEGELRV